MPTNTAKTPFLDKPVRRHLLSIFHTLLKHFGPRYWWPSDSAWETMVGAILVQNTAWINAERAIAALKASRSLSVKHIAEMPLRHLEKLIHSSGFYRQKAQRLQAFARYLQKHPTFYRQLCGKSSESDFIQLRSQLLLLNGIGPETADSILLYAGHYPTFVVDAYTRRMGHRIGLFTSQGYEEIQRYFEAVLPRKVPMYNEFHALIVTLCKTYCKRSDPKCPECPLQKVCVFGRKVIKATTH